MLRLTITPEMILDATFYCGLTLESLQQKLSEALHTKVKINVYRGMAYGEEKLHRDFDIGVRSRYLKQRNTLEFRVVLLSFKGIHVVPNKLLFKLDLNKEGIQAFRERR